ncbi:MAG: hypothetical protein WCG31_10245 [Deltaproteobacteria bacterium]
MTDSSAVLEAEGISVSRGIDVKVKETTDTQLYMIIPPKPSNVSGANQKNSARDGQRTFELPQRGGPTGRPLL